MFTYSGGLAKWCRFWRFLFSIMLHSIGQVCPSPIEKHVFPWKSMFSMGKHCFPCQKHVFPWGSMFSHAKSMFPHGQNHMGILTFRIFISHEGASGPPPLPKERISRRKEEILAPKVHKNKEVFWRQTRLK